MAKKSKPKSEEEEQEVDTGNGSSDIFKLLFGKDAKEEVGLGFASNPRNGEIKRFDVNVTDDSVGGLSKKKKKKREKEEKSELDEEDGGLVDEENKKRKKKKEEEEEGEDGAGDLNKEKKKKKKKKEVEIDSDAEKKRKKEEVVEEGEEGVGDLKKEKKKKKKTREGESNLVGELVGNDEVKEEGKEVEKREEEIGDLKKRKKRKRDEIEQEYEARKYGVVGKVEVKEGDEKGRKVGEKRKTVDDPAEMMVSREGYDDESKLLRTVFVGNLPVKLKKKALLKEFVKFGEVESVRIRSVPLLDTKTPRKGAIHKGKINEAVDSVHAYIVFKDEKSAQASLSHNMAVVGGNHIRVDMACPPRKKLKGDDASPLYENRRTIFVGNLPFDVKDEELYKLFCGLNQQESSVEAVRVIRDPNSSLGKGVAYVLFKTRDAANLVLKKKHLKLRDRDLRLSHAKSDPTPSNKRALTPSSADGSSAKRLAVGVNGSNDSNKRKTRALSYQGLQATKSIKKKDDFRPRTAGGQGISKPKSVNATPEGKKPRQTKRPAVAARKAKALKVAASPNQTGKKRKPESRTPESFKRNKKARR